MAKEIQFANVSYVCTCLPRGNQVDGLPRACKYLAILSTDFSEKLSDLSFGYVVSDSESESFQKIFVAKIELH